MTFSVLLPPRLTASLESPVVWLVSASLLCTLCYYNGLHGQLVHDDIFAIRDNADLRPSTPWTQLFLNDFWVLTFRLNYLLHELEPFGYHVVNVVLHTIATLLLGCVCRCVIRGGVEVSFLSMCLFAVHPIHSEAVTGIVGRADVLACICFFLCLLVYRTSLHTPHTLTAITKVGGCVLLCGCGMVCKEHGVTVVGACLALDVGVANRKLVTQLLTGKRPSTSDLWPLMCRCIVLCMTLVILLGARIWLLHGQLPSFGRQDNPASFADSMWTRMMTYSYLLYYNARLLVFPAILSYDYQMGSISLVEQFSDPRNIATVIFCFVVCCLLISCMYKNDHVTFLALVLIIFPFLPASNLFVRVGFVVAERILYISSAGYCVLVAYGAMATVRWQPSLRPIILLLCLTLLASFSVRTIDRNTVWANRETLFRSGLQSIPHNAKIHFNYANYLRDNGQTKDAVQYYQTALKLWPEHAVSHNNLGTLLTNLTAAEAHFRAAIEISPAHYKALCNLGANLHKQGRLEEAEHSFRRSLSLRGDYTDTLMGLAGLLADSGRGQEGRQYMERVASVDPSNTDILNNMGMFLWKIGDYKEAIEYFQGVLNSHPANYLATVGLARAYRSHGNNEKAVETFKKALSYREDADVFQLLAALYYNTGSHDLAGDMFQRALTLEPGRVDIVCGYAQTLLQLGRYGDVVATCEEALPTHPHTSCLYTALANAFLKTGQASKALEHSSVAIETAEGMTSQLETLQLHGGILKDLKHFDEAEKVFTRAVGVAPSSPAPHLNLGALYHMTGRYKQARSHYNTVLTLDPHNHLAHENLKRLNNLQHKQLHTS